MHRNMYTVMLLFYLIPITEQSIVLIVYKTSTIYLYNIIYTGSILAFTKGQYEKEGPPQLHDIM